MNGTSTRDREILREELADKIEALRPMTLIDGWRTTFQGEAARWRTRANGCPETSDARREYNGWALAHVALLDELDPDSIAAGDTVEVVKGEPHRVGMRGTITDVYPRQVQVCFPGDGGERYEIISTAGVRKITPNGTLTVADLERTLTDDRHLGWGYAGIRNLDTATVTRTHEAVIAVANELGLDYERLFIWSNSKQGRWLADHGTQASSLATVREYLNAAAIATLLAEEAVA